MQREEALELMKENIKEKNLRKHCLAVEAVMAELADYFDKDQNKWRLAGLLHDIDYEDTADQPAKHSQLGADMLAERGMDEDLVNAVRAHNGMHGLARKTLLAKALYAADPLTGLIVASALIHPEKKLEALDSEFVLNRYSDSSFAKGADRDVIASCQEMDLKLKEFVGLSLSAMQDISDQLGL
ncbi:HDIG domain-containing protein [Halanaerobium sp. Z-7514]|uniref:HDIG domain-containing protein n=1 Tax=Halanaerobium polyolivorans TaxID=2886943 RepID=A0AAW4WTV1_9FIRM|nr:HDIG domain-containing metalloprotein [Halanaerobium polyolivorans]MCC3144426.1 HDIG domain-containing protein [Halanaerobium polyolivorans]RQD69854.1 MAG: HDIG domain-containing protein [Halanaerobium sp. MSAO_Bac5]